MKVGNILFSALHFFIVFFILTVGLFFFVLPYVPHLRIFLINSLLESLEFYQILGATLIGGSFLLLLALYFINRRRFFQIEMEGLKIEVEESLISEMVSNYWKGRFPNQEPYADVVIHGKQSLEVFVTLPEEKEEGFFEEIQKELGTLLARQFGYQKPFTVNLVETFQ